MNRLSNWRRNKEAAKYRETEATMTDQSAANDTDINVIMKKYAVHGQAPGNTMTPLLGVDFTEMPDNFRDMIEEGRQLGQRMKMLPPELKGLTVDQLLALTPEQLANKLTPPKPPGPPVDKPEDTK